MKSTSLIATAIVSLAVLASPAEAQSPVQCIAYTLFVQAAATGVCSPSNPMASPVTCAISNGQLYSPGPTATIISTSSGLKLQISTSSCTASTKLYGTFPGKFSVRTPQVCGQSPGTFVGTINSVTARAGGSGQTSNQVAVGMATSSGNLSQNYAISYLMMMSNWNCPYGP